MDIKKTSPGFTLVEIMIVIAIISLLAVIAIPGYMRVRETAQRKSCVANLKEIDEAISLWALDGGKGSDDAVTMEDLVGDYIKTTPYCPLDSEKEGYVVTVVSASPVCPKASEYPGHVLPPDNTQPNPEQE